MSANPRGSLKDDRAKSIIPTHTGSRLSASSRNGETITAVRQMATDVFDHRHASMRQGTLISEAMSRELLQSALADATQPVDILVSCSTWSYFERIGLTDLIRDSVIGRGHQALVLHEHQAALRRSDHSLLDTLFGMGVEVRLLARLLPDIAIVGDELAVLTSQRNLLRPQCLLVKSGSLLGAMRQLHGALWEEATAWKQPHATVVRLFSDPIREQVLIKLCSGATDEAAARQLNVSVRTYRRHVAAILDGLSVTSRFQAGLKAAELGLLAMCESYRSPEADQSAGHRHKRLPACLAVA